MPPQHGLLEGARPVREPWHLRQSCSDTRNGMARQTPSGAKPRPWQLMSTLLHRTGHWTTTSHGVGKYCVGQTRPSRSGDRSRSVPHVFGNPSSSPVSGDGRVRRNTRYCVERSCPHYPRPMVLSRRGLDRQDNQGARESRRPRRTGSAEPATGPQARNLLPISRVFFPPRLRRKDENSYLSTH